jgi:hypothetical protein
MKSYSKIIQLTAFLGVLYFVLAGVGHNVVNYCCDSCESAGIEYLSSHKCSELHHPEHTGIVHSEDLHVEVSTSCCDHTGNTKTGSALTEACSMNEGHCEIARLQLDDYPVTGVVQLQVNEAVTTLPVAVLTTKALTTVQSDLFLHYPPPEPPLRMGRQMLVQKSVLII